MKLRAETDTSLMAAQEAGFEPLTAVEVRLQKTP